MKESIVILEKRLADKPFSPAVHFAKYLENGNVQRTRKLHNHRYFGKEIRAHSRTITY